MSHAQWRVGIFRSTLRNFVRTNDIDSFAPHFKRNLRLDARARTARWAHFRPRHGGHWPPLLKTFIDIRHSLDKSGSNSGEELPSPRPDEIPRPPLNIMRAAVGLSPEQPTPRALPKISQDPKVAINGKP
ncbi:predicted protein [Chaetomium globosum CBS 148.51]|uniref:Uncharacterized protein n=1 Tax=Chaetomium globosum (strain ATCC 6205 / CBS 148.51 / DSM 1962 / NBRC 6347 / NRRL 1970) TaxID=306901 RepID=Q2GVR1_CHAGB|nr:uncharacterized protein CHGG_07943 [Chaetomium globosum CBS 148.51]EAQ86690.1 predicted protein [Chaetomium globosum CBS 148.51]